MRLRKPCEHDRYEEHVFYQENGNRYAICPGGEFLPEDFQWENGWSPEVLKTVPEDEALDFIRTGQVKWKPDIRRLVSEWESIPVAADQVGEPG